jgi:hypothetical protein
VSSSISSSSPPVSNGPWIKTWALAGSLALIALLAHELTWRSRDFKPWGGRDQESWSLVMDRVGDDSVIVVGTSRALVGIDPAVLGERLGRRVSQLSINGGSPLPVLEELAATRHRFRGLILVDLVPRVAFDPTGRGERTTRGYLDNYRTFSVSPAQRIEARLTSLVQRRLVCRNPSVSWKRMLAAVSQGKWPRPAPAYRRSDRLLRIEFSPADLEKRRKTLLARARRAGIPASTQAMNDIVRRFRHATEMIESRGGKLVLIYMPTSGMLKDAEQKRFPRIKYWDEVVKEIGVASIHVDDLPALQVFVCPEGSHLDQSDAAAFTSRLASAITRVIEPNHKK